MISVKAIDLSGLARIENTLKRIGTLTMKDMEPLLEKLEDILVEDNRKGVLSGMDGHDQPMPPLKYRKGKGRKTNPRKRGFGSTSGFNPNPVNGRYGGATGPRLAPFRTKSRVITNYHTRHGQVGNTFLVEGAWADVVSKKGVEFLPFHFKGGLHLPKYDLVGIRAWGRQEAVRAVRAHMADLLRRRV